MHPITRRNFIELCAALPLGTGMVTGLRAAAESSCSAASVQAHHFETPSGSVASRRFPNVEVLTHDGHRRRFYDDLVKDKIVLISFFYARCERFCPPQTANLGRVQKLLGDRVGRDVFMYSITLKPREDTQEQLLEYAEMHGIKPGWTLLTGKPQDMELLRVKLGFRDSDPEIDKDTGNHIGMLLFGNDALDRWSGCPAMSSPEEILRELAWMDRAIPPTHT